MWRCLQSLSKNYELIISRNPSPEYVSRQLRSVGSLALWNRKIRSLGWFGRDDGKTHCDLPVQDDVWGGRNRANPGLLHLTILVKFLTF